MEKYLLILWIIMELLGWSMLLRAVYMKLRYGRDISATEAVVIAVLVLY